MGRDHVPQSGIQWRPVDKPHEAMKTSHLMRGVVVATYLLDNTHHPYASVDPTLSKPTAVYCDVLCYSNITGQKWVAIPKAMVLQDKGNMHSGRVWKPKASTMNVTGILFEANGGTNPANFDGDHVLVGFIDGLKSMPMILGGVPHPSRDLGNEDRAVGHRTYLKLADGDPDIFRHHGSFYGIDDTGDFVVNSTCANDGDILPDGTEKPPPVDGTGAQRHYLPQDAEHLIELDDMTAPDSPVPVSFQSLKKALYELSLEQTQAVLTIAQAALELKLGMGATFKVEGKDALAKLTLGDGLRSALIAEAWQIFWDGPFMAWAAAHIHPTGVGPSGPPDPSTPGPFPPYATSLATSTKVKFPDL
jgi:hypothetical protein